MSPGVSIGTLRKGGFYAEATPVILSRIRVARIAVRNLDVKAPAGRGYTSVTIPLTSGFEIRGRGSPRYYDAESAHIQSPDHQFHLQTDGAVVIVVNIEDATLADIAAKLAGAGHESELSLDGEMSLLDAHASAFWREAASLWCELRGNSQLLRSAIALPERELSLVEDLLLALGSTERSSDVGRSDPAAPGMCRAAEWICEHLQEPITRADLCAVSGLNVRTLSRVFRRRYGQGPVTFVRERRLDAVHRRLLASDREQTSVSEVALDYGFAHLGRFAENYRRAFGELPSDTLRH